MKSFIKSGYLFLIFFVLLFSKDYLLSFLAPQKDISLDSYTKALEKEVESLKVIKNYNLKDSFSYARLFYSNPYKPGEIVILTGSDKVSAGDLVINDRGLVGTISKARKNSAQVKLLTSEDTIMQVKLQGYYAVMKYDGALYLDNLDNYKKIEVGQAVYTSNLGIFDEEILIGYISHIQDDKNELAKKYYLDPAVDFNDLSYFIVISKEG